MGLQKSQFHKHSKDFINIHKNTKSWMRSPITPLQKQPPKVFYEKAVLNKVADL